MSSWSEAAAGIGAAIGAELGAERGETIGAALGRGVADAVPGVAMAVHRSRAMRLGAELGAVREETSLRPALGQGPGVWMLVGLGVVAVATVGGIALYQHQKTKGRRRPRRQR